MSAFVLQKIIVQTPVNSHPVIAAPQKEVIRGGVQWRSTYRGGKDFPTGEGGAGYGQSPVARRPGPGARLGPVVIKCNGRAVGYTPWVLTERIPQWTE